MCGRITLTTPGSELASYLQALDSLSWPPRYNIAPTQPVATVRIDEGGQRRIVPMRWGLIPRWADGPEIGNQLINARAETIARKPAFKDAFRERRCLVVADGFYEWRRTNGTKQPYYLYDAEGKPLTFAGVWDTWQRGPEDATTCAIVTTDANELVAPIHDRMPVVLDATDWDRWLDPDISDPAALREFLSPCPEDRLATRPVSTVVNDPRNDVPACIEPAPRIRIVPPSRQGKLDF